MITPLFGFQAFQAPEQSRLTKDNFDPCNLCCSPSICPRSWETTCFFIKPKHSTQRVSFSAFPGFLPSAPKNLAPPAFMSRSRRRGSASRKPADYGALTHVMEGRASRRECFQRAFFSGLEYNIWGGKTSKTKTTATIRGGQVHNFGGETASKTITTATIHGGQVQYLGGETANKTETTATIHGGQSLKQRLETGSSNNGVIPRYVVEPCPCIGRRIHMGEFVARFQRNQSYGWVSGLNRCLALTVVKLGALQEIVFSGSRKLTLRLNPFCTTVQKACKEDSPANGKQQWLSMVALLVQHFVHPQYLIIPRKMIVGIYLLMRKGGRQESVGSRRHSIYG